MESSIFVFILGLATGVILTANWIFFRLRWLDAARLDADERKQTLDNAPDHSSNQTP
jgi:hypothetical protein